MSNAVEEVDMRRRKMVPTMPGYTAGRVVRATDERRIYGEVLGGSGADRHYVVPQLSIKCALLAAGAGAAAAFGPGGVALSVGILTTAVAEGCFGD